MAQASAQGQDWSWLYQKLAGGTESTKELGDFLQAGGRASDVVIATLGNREEKVRPCPQSLEFLLKARADPNMVDGRMGSPLLHLAAWMSTAEVASLLLDHRANIEIGEEGVPTPPLNTALAAGNAPVALLLLKRRANVQWKHEDGATALHVATAWISDDTRARRRMPPLGDEPREIVSMLLHNGIDPTQREGMKGLTPLDGFREGMRRSPWLQDEKIGEEFKRTSERIYSLLTAADEAMKLKTRGNKAFGEGRYEAALNAWTEGREALEKEAISGHHMAVLWSNEAMCCKKMGDADRCRTACKTGLGLFSLKSVKDKLEHNLAECDRPQLPTGDKATASVAKAPAAEASADAAAAAATAQAAGPPEEPAPGPAAEAAAPPARRRGTELKGGFLKDIGESKRPMYGAAGSVQGKNHSDMVLAPVHGQMHKVPYGKVLPVTVPNPYLEAEADSD